MLMTTNLPKTVKSIKIQFVLVFRPWFGVISGSFPEAEQKPARVVLVKSKNK